MKRSNKTWILWGLQLVFMIVLPCIFIWVQYGDYAVKYKISVTAILLTLLVFLVSKKIFFSKWLKGIDQKIINIESNALSIVDKNAIETNKKAWRTYSLIQLFFNSIIPLLFFVLLLITIKTVEQGLIKLYGCLSFCFISICLGLVFHVAEIYSMKLVHETDL